MNVKNKIKSHINHLKSQAIDFLIRHPKIMKIVSAIITIAIIWMITPWPEGAIILALLTGGSAYFSGVSWQLSLATSIITFPITWYLCRRFKILDRLRKFKKAK
jgi:Na+/H+-translocating membrane pyrophosphatase